MHDALPATPPANTTAPARFRTAFSGCLRPLLLHAARMTGRPTAAVQLEMGCRLSTPPLKLAVGVCRGLMHSLRPCSRALAGLVAALLFSIHAIA